MAKPTAGPVTTLLRLARYGLVGGLATVTYAVLAIALVSRLGMDPTTSSALAFLIAIPVSYLGQKHFTFASKGATRTELPRFLVVQGLNLIAATLIMRVVAVDLGLGHVIGTIAVVATIPLATYVMLNRAVFR